MLLTRKQYRHKVLGNGCRQKSFSPRNRPQRDLATEFIFLVWLHFPDVQQS